MTLFEANATGSPFRRSFMPFWIYKVDGRFKMRVFIGKAIHLYDWIIEVDDLLANDYEVLQ